MISLRESILSGRKQSIDSTKGSLVMDWFRGCSRMDTCNAYVESHGDGYDIIIDDYTHQPMLYTLHLSGDQLRNIPKSLRGIYLNHHNRKDDEGRLRPITFEMSSIFMDTLDLSQLEYTKNQNDHNRSAVVFSNCTFKNVKGLPKYDEKGTEIEFRRSIISGEISVDDPNVSLWAYDNTSYDLHKIRGCRLKRLIIGDSAITSTTNADLEKDPNTDFGWEYDGRGFHTLFVRRGSHYYTNSYLTGVLDELKKNNKIEKISILTNFIQVSGITGCSCDLTRKANGWEINKCKF